ncbi:MAG: hypothetical protein A2X25_08500 [Chloroflexi bacterium GWB2_49_20]|nr:MAG: hypothetical protein A2X25_08500 [Chloroflexi bacterium GWB2_49_20]OGN79525.1 MAG: hypothetical protein A2X26_05525 [Chloroflexi bacterium GWC2_49_37]OGN84552.1 MAG: hypothetical protein A2X27_11005 [Chloroflexi bacterium GWD2_49_16]HBG74024.1 hypothetical protein [Anaerolineae bacterium]HCC78826.1 hypothetical protein [Anaerolineae bacterium]
MKKIYFSIVMFLFFLTSCGPGVAAATPTEELDPTSTIAPTALAPTPTTTLEPIATLAYPSEGLGPDNFPQNVDPLTGLVVRDPSLLDRRPLMIKISNLPRYVRPQWGLTLADHVYEYYTEYGTTRFIAIYLGQDASQVGPIRSARFFDENIIQAYKAVFAFGSADILVLNRLFEADFADRLVLESNWTPMFRYDPNGYNHLMVDTSALSKYISDKGIENGRQDLDGMFFQIEPPANGQPAEHVSVRFSISIYNKWDYDASFGRYLRSSDTVEDANGGKNEAYAPLTDKLTDDPVASDNVVFIEVPYQFYRREPEQIEIPFVGSGLAYAFRDGQMYKVRWQRPTQDSMVSLAYENGAPFPFKPGNTWFEVIGSTSEQSQNEQGWRFVFHIP